MYFVQFETNERLKEFPYLSIPSDNFLYGKACRPNKSSNKTLYGGLAGEKKRYPLYRLTQDMSRKRYLEDHAIARSWTQHSSGRDCRMHGLGELMYNIETAIRLFLNTISPLISLWRISLLKDRAESEWNSFRTVSV